MGLQVPRFSGHLRIGYLLIMIIGTGLALCEVSADNHETQRLVKITGIVVDSNTEAPLVDVTIRVTDTQIRVTTDETGTFSLELPIGTYKIQANAPFYNTYVITDFEVKAGETPEPLRVLLVAQVVKLDAIKMPVQLSQSSERGLLEQRMRSSRIEDSISTEEISRLPASSAGEAIKRVTGVSIVGGRYVFVRGLGERYSNTLLNNVEIPSPEPNRRVVPMDIFPASLLASLQTVKTFSPDQPGGFAGGSVQVFTKDFPEELTMSLSMSTGFNHTSNWGRWLDLSRWRLRLFRALTTVRVNFQASLKIRQRMCLSGSVDVLHLLASRRKRFRRSGNRLRMSGPQNANLSPVNQGYKFSLGNSNTIFGKQFGYLGVISYGNSHSYGTQVRNAYRIGLNQTLSPVTSYAIEQSGNEVDWGTVLNTSLRFSPEHLISLKTLFTHTAENETRTWEGFNADRNTDMRSTRLRYVERQLFSGQFAGMHDFNFGEPNPELEVPEATCGLYGVAAYLFTCSAR